MSARWSASSGCCIAVVAAAVLLIDYFIQFSVMPLSLQKEQLEGWALFTQYNPNGVFLALEELGFLLMRDLPRHRPGLRRTDKG